MRAALLVCLSLGLAACSSVQPAGVEPARVEPARVEPARAAPADLEVEPAAVRPSDEMAERPRNVVLMIADGFGPASATMGAMAKGAPLAFDSLLVGSVETSATDSRVTDSAASATAYACGIKTYNGAIGVTPEGAPCRTVLEAADARGMATGLVATSRVTHATPASFVAHVPQRAQEAEIAAQMADSGLDVLFGGGRSYFAARPTGDAPQTDLRPLTAVLEDEGWSVALDRDAYDDLDATPAAALLSDSHLAYEVDRDETDQPSLAEMTVRALDLLAASPQGRANGFFVMVEGSRIDHAGHGNDPVGHVGDILAYDRAVEAALEWARRDGTTLVVSTADHETGGMTLGRDGLYAWDPAPVLAATSSYEAMGTAIAAGADPVETVRVGLGLDALEDGAAEALGRAVTARNQGLVLEVLNALVSEPAGIGWTTGGHTAVDVGLYAFGPGAGWFRGRMVNAAVGRALFDALGLGAE